MRSTSAHSSTAFTRDYGLIVACHDLVCAIPVGSIDGIIVTKTTLPDHEAEGLGGTIELTPRTATNLDSPFFDGTLGWGYEPAHEHTGPFNAEIAGGARSGPFSFVLTASRRDDRRCFDDIEEDPEEDVASWLASDWIERVEFDGYTSETPPFGLVRNTRELHFGTDNYGPDVLERLRDWPHLRALGVSYLLVPWAELAALPHLRALRLDNPDWEMMPALHEARLPNLEVLDLDK